MSSILLFNIGFRCENICKELKRYKKNQTINPHILNDSKNIVSDCFKIKESYAESLSYNDFAIGDFYPLIFRAFPNKDINAITTALEEIKSSLDTIGKGSTEEDVTAALTFFNTISDLCLSYHEYNNTQTKVHLM